MESIKELKEQKQDISEQLDGIKETVESDNRVMTTEEISQWDELSDNLKSLNENIETQERFLSSPKAEDKPQVVRLSSRKPRNNDAAFRAWALTQANRKEYVSAEWQSEAQRQGVALDQPLTGSIRWDQTVGTDTAGGLSVNEEVVAGVVRKLKAYGGMVSTCHSFSTSYASPLKKVVHDSTSFKAQKTAELGTIQNTNQAISKVTFGATEYTSGVYEISHMLLRDSAYNIVGEFQSAVAESFSRAFNDVLTNGTAADEPQGLEGAVSTGVTGAISHDNMLALMHSIDPAYRRSNRCAWMMNDATLLALKLSLKDADGRPLYNTSVNSNVVVPAAGSVEGFPVVVNQDMSADTIMFGDYSKYEIRFVGGLSVRVLNELFALTNGIGIVGHQAIDGRLVDTGAIKKLVTA